MDERRPQLAESQPDALNRALELTSAPLVQMRGPATSASSLLLAAVTIAYVFVVLPAGFLIRWLAPRRFENSVRLNKQR